MNRFSANISTLFTELPVIERFEAAAKNGFSAFEIQFPYDIPIENILSAKQRSKLETSIFNFPAGDFSKGGPGIASIPGLESYFHAGVAEAKLYADALQPYGINILAGCPPEYINKSHCLHTLKNNIEYASKKFINSNIKILIEPINVIDRPNYLISNFDMIIELINDLNLKNVSALCDIYHIKMMGEDPLEIIKKYLKQIGHIQFADFPGRNEPGTGEIDFDSIFSSNILKTYNGWLGAEYLPKFSTSNSLYWLEKYLN
ncbi:TIM barrel protein [Alphaproteobacteria bacterium]|nr:TIM barrel protein [Alphaproteobacteria bacterium]